MSDHSEPAGTLRLAGRVVDPDGHGHAGARVWIDALPPRTAISAADGSFTFEGLLRRTYQVRARAGELIGGPQSIRLGAHGASMVIGLREGAHLVVRVVDAARAPVAQAEVRVIGYEAAAPTDAAGQVRLTAHPGWVALEASAPGYAPRRVDVTSAAAGTTSRAEIVLHEGFEVRGRVVDQDRRPIPNVRIYARQASGRLGFHDTEPATAVTDEAGAFELPSAVGMHALIAIDDDHAPAIVPELDVDHPITDLEIVMKGGGVYAGRVVDPDGEPVARARVYVDTLGPLGPRRFATASDDGGAFELRGLPRAPAMAHAASDAGTSDPATVSFIDEPGLRDQRLVVATTEAAAGTIAGVVVDDTGAPVGNAVVHAAADQPGMLAWSSSHGVDLATASSATTNGRGEFTLADLPVGSYGVWPGALDQPPFPAPARPLVAGQDASSFMTTARTGDRSVRLVQPRPGRLVAKVAFADTGGPVDDFVVDLGPRGDREAAIPGRLGALDVPAVRPGSYALRITGRDFLAAERPVVHVAAGSTTDVGTILVDRGRTLTGTVVDDAGRGVAGARVVASLAGVVGGGRLDEPLPDNPGAITDASGAFTIRGGVPVRSAGLPYVVADHPSYGRTRPVALRPDTQALTLVLRACGSIAGTVTEAGKPLARATIGAGWPEYGVAVADDDGNFVLSRLPAGPVVLRIYGSTMHAYQRTVEVQAGARSEVAIDVPVGTLTLAVDLKPKAAGIAGALLFLFPGGVTFDDYAQLSERLFPDSQGLGTWRGDPAQPASFERLVPGDYTICTLPLAWSPDDQARMQDVHAGDRARFRVACTPARVAAAPQTQRLVVELPATLP